MRRCGVCSHWEPAGAPGCARCAALVDEIVEEGWRAFLAAEFATTVPGRAVVVSDLGEKRGVADLVPAEERAIAEMVVDEPDKHLWRVVDAAYDRLTCDECGGRLSRGPAGCASCDLANGFRYAAIEIDRPGVTPGNEHGLRVNVSVVRRPSGISPPELLARRLLLPLLLEGRLPTTAEAQAGKALLNDGATEAEFAEYIYGEWGAH
ncbi:hypothetical protein ABZ297_33775 [Nonomuraea sp. NPDC005983]|uniref:hypothetical protein n=1 Tax=Nonomuraea sp. NPDC005983 TaxID=3155595 RepID=UPI00339DC0B5